jgi:hypothetical protein
VQHWNSPTKESDAPAGRPEMLYNMPEAWNHRNVGHPLPDDLRRVAQIAASDLANNSDIFDITDPFDLKQHSPILVRLAVDCGFVPINRDNMTECFQSLRANQGLRLCMQ